MESSAGAICKSAMKCELRFEECISDSLLGCGRLACLQPGRLQLMAASVSKPPAPLHRQVFSRLSPKRQTKHQPHDLEPPRGPGGVTRDVSQPASLTVLAPSAHYWHSPSVQLCDYQRCLQVRFMSAAKTSKLAKLSEVCFHTKKSPRQSSRPPFQSNSYLPTKFF
jgi:hypothetical protein